MALGHLERSWKDDEEVVAIKKERDELLWRENEARQQALDLLAEAERERDLKLGAEDKLAAVEARARQDVATIDRLHKERDESCQAMT